MKIKYLLGLILLIVVLILSGCAPTNQGNCQQERFVNNIINNICVGEGKELIEFTVDVSDIFVMSVTSERCYESYKEKYGSYHSGTCLLKEASSFGETKVGKAQFLTEYTCACWD
jgi:hypothetical protein